MSDDTTTANLAAARRVANAADLDQPHADPILWPCSFCHSTGFNERTEVCAQCRGMGCTP